MTKAAPLRFAVAGFVLMVAASAQAGTLTYQDGQGTWASSECQKPTPGGGLSEDPDIAANDINGQIARHNAYVRQVDAYMTCLSNEAGRDSAATAQLVARAAQQLMEQAQAEAAQEAAHLKKR